MSYGEKPFEAFRVGDTTTFSKTITEADILLFAAVSGDNYPLHVDAEYAKTTRFGQRAAHGMLSASLLSTVVGMLLHKPGGIYVELAIRFKLPVFVGDTIYASSEILNKRESGSRPDVGIVTARTTGVNQRGQTVISYERTFMVYRRDKDPRDSLLP